MASAALPFLFLLFLVFPQQLLNCIGIPFFSRPQIADVCQTPDGEVGVLVDFADAAVAELQYSLCEVVEFRSDGGVHSAETNSPGNGIGQKVRQLHE